MGQHPDHTPWSAVVLAILMGAAHVVSALQAPPITPLPIQTPPTEAAARGAVSPETPTPVASLQVPAPAVLGDSELQLVAEWMTGDFDTFAQVARDQAAGAAYTHIRAVMHIVPAVVQGLAESGRTFYVEQAASEAQDKPYRQRVYLLTRTNGVLINRIYRITDPAPLAGAWQKPERLAALRVEDLHLEEGCDLIWTRVGNTLFTGIAGLNNTCRTSWRGATHAVSQVMLTPESITSLDQGFDAAGTHVWGPKPGLPGHVFAKRNAPESAAAIAREFARLRAGDGSGEVFWMVEGTMVVRGDRGVMTPINGVIGYNVARLEAGPGPDEWRMVSREVFALTDLARGTILPGRPPITNAVTLGIGIRGGRPVAGIDFTSNGRDMSAAVPPVEIIRVESAEGVRLFTAPFVNAEIAGHRWWASELYEFLLPAGVSDPVAAARLIWLREGEMPGQGRIHYATSGRRFTSIEAVASSSPLAARLVELVRSKLPEFASAPAAPPPPA